MLSSELYSQIQRHLIETVDGGLTWSSGLWTSQEVANTATFRQQEFLRLTHLQIGIAEVTETQNVSKVALPTDWLATVLVLRKDATGTYTEIPVVDSHQIDMAGDSNVPGTPVWFIDGEQETLTARLFPAPAVAGLLELYYVPIGTTLPVGTTDAEVSVLPPEMLVPGVKWGIISDLLAKVGRGRDDSRIQLAQQRYQFVIEAVRMLMKGLA